CVSLIIFFFSSRRRHTRFSRDWSSDVCSSDLVASFAYSITTVEQALELGFFLWCERLFGIFFCQEVESAKSGGFEYTEGDKRIRSEERRVGKERKARW